MKTYVLGLCRNRHPAPVREAIFNHEIDFSMGTSGLREMAERRIPQDCERLALYTSGCVIALMAVVAVCAERGIKLTTYHYIAETHSYDRQDVF